MGKQLRRSGAVSGIFVGLVALAGFAGTGMAQAANESAAKLPRTCEWVATQTTQHTAGSNVTILAPGDLVWGEDPANPAGPERWVWSPKVGALGLVNVNHFELIRCG